MNTLVHTHTEVKENEEAGTGKKNTFCLDKTDSIMSH